MTISFNLNPKTIDYKCCGKTLILFENIHKNVFENYDDPLKSSLVCYQLKGEFLLQFL